MEDPLVTFAVSWVTLHVSKVGSENFVNSWNYHRIPGETVGALDKGRCTFMLGYFLTEFR